MRLAIATTQTLASTGIARLRVTMTTGCTPPRTGAS
jgi:hypothetical protein